MTHGSLFSGIGGFDLAADWMGWQNAFHCENNPFGQKILKYYWPHATSYSDITATDFSAWRGRIDILTGGFPCQPYSTAGKRLGKDDDRHLWPHMLRAIREIRPRFVVGENVRGLISWNAGMVFDEVQAELETEGYEVVPFLLPAAGVGAPHQRYRIWFVAHAKDHGCERWADGDQRHARQLYPDESGRDKANGRESLRCGEAAPDSESIGRGMGPAENERPASGEKHTPGDPDTIRGAIAYAHDRNKSGDRLREAISEGVVAGPGSGNGRPNWEGFPTQSPICTGDDGVSARLDFAAVFGSVKHPRQPAKAFGRWRNESIKGAGNAIVPQVALQIFKAIDEHQMFL